MKENKRALKKKIAEMVRILAAGDILTLSSGHLSYRIPETEEVLIPRHLHHEGKTLDEVTEGDIVVMDLEGNVLEGDQSPPGERFVHTCIYKRRKDVHAVIHAHPYHSMAFGVAGVEMIPVYHRAIVFAPRVEIFDFSGQVDHEEVGMKVAEALKENVALLLRGHGTVVVGKTPEEACCNAFALETNAKIQLWASILGNPQAVTKEEVLGLTQPGKKPHSISSAWSYYVKKYGSK